MAYSSSVNTDLILWDIVEEHFDEAAFLFEHWERALYSPMFNLNDLDKIERRLEAHVDGLLVGGPEVGARILHPEAVNEDEPTRATVAAITLLLGNVEESSGWLVDEALRAPVALQQALTRAFVLVGSDFLDHVVLARLQSPGSELQHAVLLDVLTGRGIDVGEQLHRWSNAEEPCMIGAVLGAACRFGRHEFVPLAEQHLTPNDPVRAKALSTSLVLGSNDGWRVCRELARGLPIDDFDPLVFLALLGQPADHAILSAQLENPANTCRALSALGFCGTVEVGDSCLEYLNSDNECVSKAAAESIAWIAGLDLNDRQFRQPASDPSDDQTLPPLDEDDLDADLGLDALDELPVPYHAAVSQSWVNLRHQFTLGRRHLLGKPYSHEAVIHALESASLGRRRGIALELNARSGGRGHVSTNVFSACQRRQVAALGSQRITTEA